VGYAHSGPSADCTICFRAHWPSEAVSVHAIHVSIHVITDHCCRSPHVGSFKARRSAPLPPSLGALECQRQAIWPGDPEFQSPEPDSPRWMDGFLFLHGFGVLPIATSALEHLVALGNTMRLWRAQVSKSSNCLRDSPETAGRRATPKRKFCSRRITIRCPYRVRQVAC
jgi:hypothetical protein